MELDLSTGAERDFDMNYDELGRLTDRTVSSSESSAPGWLLRQFAFTHSAGTGETWRIGPDGSSTYVRLDENGRVAFVSREGTNFPMISASYTYGVDGLMLSVAYGNGTRTEYAYDAARRVTSIDHRRFTGMQYETMLKLVYAYQDNDLVAQIDEYDQFGLQAGVVFAYDTRGRLISEVRTGDNAYDLAYEYDQGGNRTLKIQILGPGWWIVVVYAYDISDPLLYQSNNNRLKMTEKIEVIFPSMSQGTIMEGNTTTESGASGKATSFPVEPTQTLLETTWYYYNGSGNVTDVQTQFENPPVGLPSDSRTQFHYARNGETVTFVYGETWGNGTINQRYAREFRYDSARARYLDRKLDALRLFYGNYVVLSDRWSDYDGDQVYGDYSVTQDWPAVPGGPLPPPYATNLSSYQSGIAKFSWMDDGAGQMVPDPGSVAYYHSDLIGTTRFMTEAGGNIIDPAVYTAFGEKVCSLPGGDCTNTTDHRYGYAGAYGYQSTINDTTGVADFPFLHVGHRYYDPSSGRFLQRDPSGIRSGPSGPNVYLYVAARPLRFVDPLGLFSLESAIVGGILGGGVGAASGGTPPVILICAIAGFIGNGYEDGDAENFWEKVKKNPPNMPLPGDSIMMDCFVDGTPVWTTDGLVDIATINLGSRVLSTDPHGGDVSAQIIIGKRSRLVRELVVITLPYEILRCTSEHPFCTKGKGWVKAAQLSTGDILQDVTGTGVTIVKVGTEMVVDPIRVQTITVDGTHTYYVGKSRVLVHNKPLG